MGRGAAHQSRSDPKALAAARGRHSRATNRIRPKGGIEAAAGGAGEAGEDGVDVGVVLVDPAEGSDDAIAEVAGFVAEGFCELRVDAAAAAIERDEHVATETDDGSLDQC